MTTATTTMKEFNPRALIGTDTDGAVVMIEDVRDPDGRLYRMEYRSTPDGAHGVAYCRSNPWGAVNGGAPYHRGHVSPSGFLCLGDGHNSEKLADSNYDIGFTIKRARYWCTAFSVFKETGEFPNP